MDTKKATEGLENFITTDAISSTLANVSVPAGLYQPCYGVKPPKVDK